MFDAAEIARLRKRAGRADAGKRVMEIDPRSTISLLDALEQARNDLDLEETLRIECQDANSGLVRLLSTARTQRDAAQQSAEAARALLVEIAAWRGYTSRFRTRIEDFLEPKV